MNTDKDMKRDLFYDSKVETLDQNRRQIGIAYEHMKAQELGRCDLLNGNIEIVPCITKEQKDLWCGYVHLVSSLPFRRSVGRRKRFFVVCDNYILGMVNLTSAMAQLRLRDGFIGWDKEEKWANKGINGIYNIQTCVPTRRYAHLLTGKLLVYLVFSFGVTGFLEESYGDPVLGFETTSLYGKSSMYNRIPFLHYLGLTDGNSAVYIAQPEWKRIIKEYYEVYPNTDTNRLAPVKYQIIDKLNSWYISHGKEFPYQYQSVEYKRGIYFGYTQGITQTVQDMADSWRDRWLAMRMKTKSLDGQLGDSCCSVSSDWVHRNLSQEKTWNQIQLAL